MNEVYVVRRKNFTVLEHDTCGGSVFLQEEGVLSCPRCRVGVAMPPESITHPAPRMTAAELLTLLSKVPGDTLVDVGLGRQTLDSRHVLHDQPGQVRVWSVSDLHIGSDGKQRVTLEF